MIAGRVLDRELEVVAAVDILSLMRCNGAKHERGQQQWKVNYADLEQIACNHSAFRLGGCAKDARKPDRVGEIEETQESRQYDVSDAGHSELPRCKADGDHHDCIEQRFNDGGPAVWLNDGQHANAGASIVFAVEPCNRHEVRELPHEENCKEGYGRPFDAAPGGGRYSNFGLWPAVSANGVIVQQWM